MRISKLFKKALVIVVLLFGLIAATISLLSAWILSNFMEEEYRSKAVAIARSIASSNPETFIHLDAAAVQSIIDQYTEIKGVSYVVVSSPYGEIIAHTFVPRVPADVLEAHNRVHTEFAAAGGTSGSQVKVQEVGRYLDVAVPIISGVAGHVHVGMDTAIIKDAVWDAMLRMQGVTLAIFLVGVGLAYLLMNGISQPLSQLTVYAQKVAAHDFSGEPNVRSNDEVGVLAVAMAKMAEEIKHNIIEMQQAIDFATAELQDTLHQLQESEERYRTTFEHTGTAMIVIEADSTVSLMNSQFEHLCGYGREEVEGRMSWLSFVSPEDLSRVIEYRTRRRRRNDVPNQYEFSFVTRNGERRNIFISVELIPGTQKTIASLIDVTAQIRAAAAFRESEERYRLLMEASPDALAVYDPKGRITYVNPAFERIYGWSLEQLTENQQEFEPPEQAGQTRRAVERALRGERGVALETGWRTRDGRTLTVDLTGAVMRDARGEVSGTIVIHRDITKRKKAEAALKEAHDTLETRVRERTAELEEANRALKQEFADRKQAEEEKSLLQSRLQQAQKMEAVGTLASGIAHDFNNILQGISGYVQVIRNKEDLRSGSRNYLAEVDRAVERASELVQHLLTFSRRVEPELRPMDLNEVVRQTVRLLRRTIPKMIRIETKLDKSLLPVDGDRNQVERVIMNLATNARDALPDGGLLTIDTRMAMLDEVFRRTHTDLSPGEHVVLTVSDNGQGMTPDTAERVFEPFFTTKDVGRGTGLGMSMVYGIVKSHRGAITCASSPNQGTTYTIYFPVSLSPRTADKAALTIAEPDFRGGTETILLVDDEQAIIETSRDILKEMGYRTLTASNGEAALEIYKSATGPVDLIILDLGMPGMGGLTCLKELLHLNPEVRVIIASGYATAGRSNEALDMGALAFIRKPYRLQDMVAKVRHILDTT